MKHTSAIIRISKIINVHKQQQQQQQQIEMKSMKRESRGNNKLTTANGQHLIMLRTIKQHWELLQ